MATRRADHRAAIQIRARARLERLRRIRENGGSLDAPTLADRYAHHPVAYVRERLGWEPWSGTEELPGQVQVIEAVNLAIRQQEERRDFENGLIPESKLKHWRPDQIIKNIIRVEAGHTVGKTKCASAVVNQFHDCYSPSIGYTFAPSWDQIQDLLWKEVRDDRETGALPGKVLRGKPFMSQGPRQWVKGRAADNSSGKGTEKIQGQHDAYLLFVIDEAEGVADFVFEAIESMMSGGIVVVLMLANPRTRLSKFHKMKARANVRSFRISCLHHPNVLEGREVVPHGVRRDWVENMIDAHCDVIEEHEEDNHTFDVPFPVRTEKRTHPPGTIFRPNAEFMFRVLGIAPANIADNTLVPLGRYEAATKRRPTPHQGFRASLGIDVARYGKDYGTLYVCHNGLAWRAAEFAQKDTLVYVRKVREIATWLESQGVTELSIRVDGGGGFGSGIIDLLNAESELHDTFERLVIHEVHFGGKAHDQSAYRDLVTEMLAEAAETLKGLAVHDPPDALEADLCERTFEWVNLRGKAVKRLLPKEKFKKDHGRSPDDGDGFVLAVAPDFLFEHQGLEDYGNLSHSTL